MPYSYASLHSDHILAKVGDSLRAVKDAPLTIYLAGTTTAATIYADENKAIANTTGSVVTDGTGNWSAYLEPGEYYISYKGATYPKFAVSENADEGESDIAVHAALTSGVHGAPVGDPLATHSFVIDKAKTSGTRWHETTGAPAGTLGADGDYAIDKTNFYIYGPKAAGVWPAGILFKGAQGTPGDPGTLANTNPADLGPRAPGFATTVSRADHVHQTPTAAQVGAAAITGPFAPAAAGASAATRFVGGTTSGAPTAGAFNTGDLVVAHDGRLWQKIEGGWVAQGPLTTTTAARALGTTATVGGSTESARADHTHPDTGLVRASQIGSANGIASLDGSGKILPGHYTFGSTTNTVAQGNDPRIVGAQQTTAKGVANGYTGLDANARVPAPQLGSGTAAANTVLTGNGIWQPTMRVVASTTAPTDTTVAWIPL